MKDKKKVFLLVLPFILSACNQVDLPPAESESYIDLSLGEGETSYDMDTDVMALSAIDEICMDFSKQMEELHTRSDSKIDFSSCIGYMPNISEVYKLKGVYCENIDGEMNVDKQNDILESFQNQCKDLFGETNIECFYVRATDLETGNEYNLPDDLSINPQQDARIDLIGDEIKSGKASITWMFYRDNENHKYAWRTIYEEYLHWYSCGEGYCASDSASNSNLGSWTPSGLHPVVATYYRSNELTDDSYRLYGSKENVSIKDAVEFFEQEYSKNVPISRGCNSECTVSQIDVCEFQDGTYGYVIYYSSSYNGIPFNSVKEAVWLNGASPVGEIAQALMISGNTVDTNIRTGDQQIEVIGEPVKNIIPLTEVANILQKSLAQNVSIKISYIQFMYSCRNVSTRDGSESYMEYTPCWKLQAYDSVTEVNYDIFVDAISGKIKYYRYSYIN